MDSITQQIEDIEAVLRKTPHHKATNGFIGAMRAKIARLKDKEYESLVKSAGSGGGGGYAVKKHGDATVVLIGPPSAGKSTLINQLTNADSKVAEYAFTTVSVIPGMMKYKNAYIQILDVPGLIEGASIGKGRGKEVLSVARNADLLVFITDPIRMNFFESLTKELEGAGIRINKQKPKVKIHKNVSGGVTVLSNFRQTFDNQTVKNIAEQFGIKNGDITLNEKLTLDQLIDSFSARITYKPAIYVVNKSDTLSTSKLSKDYIYISAKNKVNLNIFQETIWNILNFVTVFLVGKDEKPNNQSPVIMKGGEVLLDVAKKVSTSLGETATLAKIWGNGSKFDAQEVPLTTRIVDGMQVRFI